MVTAFGKFCRKLRIDKSQIMLDMAESLGVSPAFLSAVENGKKNVPKTWLEEMTSIYKLSADDKNELRKAIELSVTEVKFNLAKENNSDRELIVAFAREFKSMDAGRKEKIRKLLCASKEGD